MKNINKTKKTAYEKPEIEIVEIETEAILAGSSDPTGTGNSMPWG